MLGRALPTSRLDLACSLSWNVIRYSLQKLRLVRWLLKKVCQHQRATPATTAGFEDEAKASARDAALAYHRLHQLHITGEGHRCCLACLEAPRALAPPWPGLRFPPPSKPLSHCSFSHHRPSAHTWSRRHGSSL